MCVVPLGMTAMRVFEDSPPVFLLHAGRRARAGRASRERIFAVIRVFAPVFKDSGFWVQEPFRGWIGMPWQEGENVACVRQCRVLPLRF